MPVVAPALVLLLSTGVAPVAFWSVVAPPLPAWLRLIFFTWVTSVSFWGLALVSAVSWPWNTVTSLAVALAFTGLSVVRTSTGRTCWPVSREMTVPSMLLLTTMLLVMCGVPIYSVRPTTLRICESLLMMSTRRSGARKRRVGTATQ